MSHCMELVLLQKKTASGKIHRRREEARKSTFGVHSEISWFTVHFISVYIRCHDDNLEREVVP